MKTLQNTIGFIVESATSRFEAADLSFGHGTFTGFDEAAFIVLESLGLPPDAKLAALWDEVLQPEMLAAIEAVVTARISTRKPAPYLLNKAYMLGVPFYVDENVLVPRSFIGEMICDPEFAPPGFPEDPRRILDLCTGSGCLAILAALAFPDAQVDAADLSAAALGVARRNIADHGLESRVHLFEGDLFAPLAGKTYDLIIANPPYVDAGGMDDLPAEYRHEPAMALGAGADGLDLIRRIIDEAPAYLAENGGLLCEVGRGQENIAAAYPRLPFLWLETEASDGEVFWITRRKLAGT